MNKNFVFILTLSMLAIGCSANSATSNSDLLLVRDGVVYEGYGMYDIVKHKETGCLYFRSRSHSNSLSPVYSTDGKTVMGCGELE